MYDTEPMKVENLPPWMEPNTVYLYKWEDKDDHSGYFAKVNCKEIGWADAVETDGIEVKSRFSFRFELADKTHVFCTDFAMQVNDWLRAVRCAKKCEDERMRTESKELKKNVDFVVTSFVQKKTEQVISYCVEEFANSYSSVEPTEDSNSVKDFIKAVQISQKNLKDVGVLD